MINKTFKNQATPKGARALAKSIVKFLNLRLPDEELLYELDLALTEACSNIALHAYPGKTKGEILINLNLQPSDYIELEIIDWGKPFYGPSENNFKLRPDAENGRGMYLISQLMDSFTYSHDVNKNILYLEKNLRGLYENT
jgi:serine/threonine-protein kinase RsbW